MRTSRIIVAVSALVAGVALAHGTFKSAAAALAPAVRQNRISPHESVSAMVDGARLTITYGRPSMRGRAIFGALVPYGVVWCPGADEATTLDSDRPLRLAETLRVPRGPHTIWMLPTADVWTLVVSKEPSGFHTRYNARADLGRVAMQKAAIDGPVERLTFAIDKNPAGGGVIGMAWETTRVSVSFSVVQ